MKRDTLRHCRFSPYLKGHGPTFNLVTYYTGRTASTGHSILGYTLSMREPSGKVTLLFEGEDFGCSPMHAIDSDDAIASLMGFLTLRPGDTDSEYFEHYTQEQLAYCLDHAEALACEVEARYGER